MGYSSLYARQRADKEDEPRRTGVDFTERWDFWVEFVMDQGSKDRVYFSVTIVYTDFWCDFPLQRVISHWGSFRPRGERHPRGQSVVTEEAVVMGEAVGTGEESFPQNMTY